MPDVKLVLDLTEDEMKDVHVVPRFGLKHVSSPRCWCQPKRDPQAAANPNSRDVWVHEPGFPS